MADIYDKVSPIMALFGPFPGWPRWREATVSVSLASSFTDATYDGLGGSNLLGGNTSESLGGSATQARWPTSARDGTALTVANMLLQEGQRSDGPADGGLYTQVGGFTFPDGVDVGGTLGVVGVGLEWQIKPALTIPPGTPPPGAILSRGRPDGMLMEMLVPVSGLGFFYSWTAEVSTDVGDSITIARNNTGFEPIEFSLPDLATLTYTFNKTLSVITTYHPPADDASIGYYPMRGSSTVAGSASVVLTFTP